MPSRRDELLPLALIVALLQKPAQFMSNMAQRSERLSKDAMFNLIKAVKKRELLWNPKHDDYKIKYMISEAWKEISEELDIPEDVLRIKWKNIRDVFKKEFKKEKDPRTKYRSQWKYFKCMAFLPLFMGEQGESGGTPTESTEADKEGSESDTDLSEGEEDPRDEPDPHKIKVEEQEMPQQPPHEMHKVYFQNDYDFPTTSSASTTTATPNRKRKNSSEEDDYDMMYLKSLYPYFKQLDPIRKLVVRSRIQDIFLKEMACVVAANKHT